jgi:hypothetical protein
MAAGSARCSDRRHRDGHELARFVAQRRRTFAGE